LISALKDQIVEWSSYSVQLLREYKAIANFDQ